jgi:hypothetical protein
VTRSLSGSTALLAQVPIIFFFYFLVSPLTKEKLSSNVVHTLRFMKGAKLSMKVVCNSSFTAEKLLLEVSR